MYHQMSHVVIGISLLLLSFNLEMANGQTTTELHNYTLSVTAYRQVQQLIIDGYLQPMINGDVWNLPDYIQLLPNNRLIVVDAVGDPPCSGVLASVYDGSLLTNSEWKCSTSATGNWAGLGFDDSSWPNAVEYGSNGNHSYCDQQQQFIGNISSNSKWIWTSNLETNYVVHCRGYLPFCENSSPCLNNGTCLPNDVEFCQCSPQFTGAYCETELQDGTLVTTAYERLMELYVDGQLKSLTNGDTWYIQDYIQLQPTNRLIALHAANLANPICGGVLASVYDGSLLTNSEWKCSPNEEVNWANLGFDDSSWPSAVEYGSNGNHSNDCNQQQFFEDINSNSKWIWTTDLNNDFAIYCRGYLPTCEQDSPCQNGGTCNRNNESICSCQPGYGGTFCEMGTVLAITAKTTLYELYVDGEPQSLLHGNNVSAADDILLPPYGRLIAVTAIDTTSTCAGILASVTGDYLVTDESWKCHTDNSPQWYKLGFNDLNWANAYVIGPNNNVTWPAECSILNEVSSISQNASWIWTSTIVNTPYYDDIIYCRAYLPLCERNSPCKNGGTCNINSVNLCTCLHGYTGVFCENDRQLTITVKSTLHELYVDGVLRNLTYGSNWTAPDAVPLSPTNRLIGVVAVDLTTTCAGVLASVTGDYLVSDANWKCQIGAPPGWYNLGFDDSIWNNAHVIGNNNNVTSPEACTILNGIPSISPDASWIWTPSIQNTPYYDQIIYCRAYLPLCELESPCLNGGTCNKNDETLCNCPVGYIGEFCEIENGTT